MENKLYYTPTIEEFHVGFECELRNSSGPIFEWEPFKIIGVDDGEISGNLMDWSFYDTRTAIKDEQIRVKYLDKSDIESLGWRFGTNDYVFPENKNVTYGQYKLLFNNNELEIIHLSGTLFRGIIKNKSELKKLMKQLSIN